MKRDVIFVPFDMNGQVVGPKQTIFNRSILHQKVQELLDQLEMKALSNPNYQFVEYGAMIVVFDSGENEKIFFTSNHPHHIGNEQIHAFNESNIPQRIQSGQKIKKVFHIHTHPGPEFQLGFLDQNPFINNLDFRAYLSFVDLINKSQNQAIEEFNGWVIVLGQNYGDIFLSTFIPFDEK